MLGDLELLVFKSHRIFLKQSLNFQDLLHQALKLSLHYLEEVPEDGYIEG